MHDHDLIVLLYFEPWLRTHWKHLQFFTQTNISYGYSLDAKKSLAVCMNAIYGYVMFPAISQKHVFGHNF